MGIELGGLYLPAGYVSGTDLAASSATFLSKSISSLGLSAGTYIYQFSHGGNADSVSVMIVPEPSVSLFCFLALAILMRRKRA